MRTACRLWFPVGPTDTFSLNGRALLFFSLFLSSPVLERVRQVCLPGGGVLGGRGLACPSLPLAGAGALTKVSHFSSKVSHLVESKGRGGGSGRPGAQR